MSKVTSFYDKRCSRLRLDTFTGRTWCELGLGTYNCYGTCPHYKAVGVTYTTTNETQEIEKPDSVDSTGKVGG